MAVSAKERALSRWQLLRRVYLHGGRYDNRKFDINLAAENRDRLLPHIVDEEGNEQLMPVNADCEQFRTLGIGVGLFMQFEKHLCVCYLLMCLLLLPVIIYNLQGYMNVPTLLDGTLANEHHKHFIGLYRPLMDLLTCCVFVGFLFVLRRNQRKYLKEYSQHSVAASDYTVLVQSLPLLRITSKSVEAFFNNHLKANSVDGKVVPGGVCLCLKYGALLSAVRELQNINREYEVIDMTRDLWDVEAQKKLKEVAERLHDQKVIVNELRNQKFPCTGMAFVTLSHKSAARALVQFGNFHGAVKAHTDTGEIAEVLVNVNVTRAPEPSDVLWDNLEIDDNRRFKNQLLTSMLAIFIICCSVCGIVFLTYWQTHVMDEEKLELTDRFGTMILGCVVITLCNVVIFALVPTLAVKYEYHLSQGSFELMCTMKLFIFQLTNAVLSAMIFLWLDTRLDPNCKVSKATPVPLCNLDYYWFKTGGNTVMNCMIGDMTFIMLVLELIRPDVLVRRYILAKKAPTQRDMNKLYEGPEFLACFRYQLLLKFIFFGLFFSSMLPTTIVFCFVFFVENYYIDKWNFTRAFKPPRQTDGSLTLHITDKVLPWAVVVHFSMAAFFFHQWQLSSKYWIIPLVAMSVLGLSLLLFYSHWLATWLGCTGLLKRTGSTDTESQPLIDSEMQTQPKEALYSEVKHIPRYVAPLTQLLMGELGGRKTLAQRSAAMV